MKTRIFLIMLVCFFSINIVKASEPTIMVKKVLTEKVVYPQKAQDLLIEGTVIVTFIIEDDGKVVVKSATSDNDVLKDGVVEQLKTVVIEPDPAFNNNTYSIKFTIELIK